MILSGLTLNSKASHMTVITDTTSSLDRAVRPMQYMLTFSEGSNIISHHILTNNASVWFRFNYEQ